MESKAFGIKGRNLIENKCENQIDARMEREARHKMAVSYTHLTLPTKLEV